MKYIILLSIFIISILISSILEEQNYKTITVMLGTLPLSICITEIAKIPTQKQIESSPLHLHISTLEKEIANNIELVPLTNYTSLGIGNILVEYKPSQKIGICNYNDFGPIFEINRHNKIIYHKNHNFYGENTKEKLDNLINHLKKSFPYINMTGIEQIIENTCIKIAREFKESNKEKEQLIYNEEKEERQRIKKAKIEIAFLVWNTIEKHFSTLQIKHKQTIYKDDYGNTVDKGWKKELKYFARTMLVPTLETQWSTSITEDEDFLALIRPNEFGYEKLIALLNIIYLNIQEEHETITLSQEIKTGIDYEHYIEQILQQNNFDVTRTPATGDQGVDLIVSKNNQRIAIQCKYYSKPVGNKAVQEVASGKDFYSCQYACVVSNNTFTPAARKLATSLNIALLNEDNLIDKLTSTIK